MVCIHCHCYVVCVSGFGWWERVKKGSVLGFHVKRVPCHHSMIYPYAVVGEESPRKIKVWVLLVVQFSIIGAPPLPKIIDMVYL